MATLQKSIFCIANDYLQKIIAKKHYCVKCCFYGTNVKHITIQLKDGCQKRY